MLVLFVLAHWGHHLLSSVIAPLLPFIRSAFDISVAESGALVSAFTIAYGLSQLPSGWLADRLGRRMLVLLGVSGVAVFGVLAGIAPGYAFMMVCMVLLGLFGGGYHPASAPSVSELVVPERRGWALGIHQIGGTLSNLSAPLFAAALATYLTWRTALVLPGAIVVVLGIILFVLMGRSKPGAAPVASKPSEATAAGAVHSRSRIVLYIITGTAAQVFIMSVIAFMPLFMVDRLNESKGLSAALQAVIYIGGMPAGPLAGYLSDRIGASKVLFVAALISGPAIFLFNAVSSLWAGIPLLLVMGAMLFTIMPVSEAYIIGHSPEAGRSTVLGIYYAASRGGSGFLTLGVGFMVGRLGYQPTFAVAGAALFTVIAACGLLLWSSGRSTKAQ
jgi:MFS family permease